MINSSLSLRTEKIAVGVALLLFVLAGCGNSPSDDGIATAGGPKETQVTASPSAASESDHERMLEFTRCMRKNGVDVPDPGTTDTEARKRVMAKGRDAVEKAFKACRKYAPAKLVDLRNDPDTRKAMLEYSRCMRKQGVNMPDPGPDGMPTFDKKLLGSPKYEAANKTCGKLIKRSLQTGGAK